MTYQHLGLPLEDKKKDMQELEEVQCSFAGKARRKSPQNRWEVAPISIFLTWNSQGQTFVLQWLAISWMSPKLGRWLVGNHHFHPSIHLKLVGLGVPGTNHRQICKVFFPKERFHVVFVEQSLVTMEV